jgi:hypothetical protein
MQILKVILPLIALGNIAGALSLFAQERWLPVGPPSWSQTVFQTTGGVSYFTHISEIPDCSRVASGPVSRTGTNLIQVINHEWWTGACTACVCYHSEVHVSVLGVLPPGDYVFQVFSWDPRFQSTNLSAQLPISVPALSAPTLTPRLDSNGSTFRLAVAGIPNVRYVIECSFTLTNWTAIATNDGGPFVWSASVSPQAANRFYRVSVFGN